MASSPRGPDEALRLCSQRLQRGACHAKPAPPVSSRRATEREVGVVAAVLVTGLEKEAAHRPGLSHST